MPILIRTSRDTLELNPEDARNVRQLKGLLERRWGIPFPCQPVSVKTVHLEDSKALCDVPESTVYLTDFSALRPKVFRSRSLQGAQDTICSIPQTEGRGILPKQLVALINFLESQSDSEGMLIGWHDTFPASPTYEQRLRLESINLYEVAEWMIKPSTVAHRCSYVELIAENKEQQTPTWFISHAWAEPVTSFVRCVAEHSRLRHLQDKAFWVCAYANNQHQLGLDLTMDPRETSFFRAMRNSVGVLLILDETATPFGRIWCCFEEAMALSKDETRNEPMLLDIATVYDGEAKLMTDGATLDDMEVKQNTMFRKIDGYQDKVKAHREATFPIQLVLLALTLIDIHKAKSAKEVDKCRILNSIIGLSGKELDGSPPEQHPKYEEINSSLRSLFALRTLPICAKRGLVRELRQIASVLGKDTAQRQSLSFNLTDMTEFDDELLSEVSAALPPKLQELELHLTRCHKITNTGLRTLAPRIPSSLRHLQFFVWGNSNIDNAGIECLAKHLPPSLEILRLGLGNCPLLGDESLDRLAAALPQQLKMLMLGLESCELMGDRGATALGRKLPKSLQHLAIDFMGCHSIGDLGVSAIAKSLSPQLSVLSLTLFSCLVGDMAMSAIAQQLTHALKMIELDLRHTQITESGIATIIERIPQCTESFVLLFTNVEGTNQRLDSRQQLEAWQLAHRDSKPLQTSCTAAPVPSPGLTAHSRTAAGRCSGPML
eukprot:TRINITY_DN23728_c0_g1_i1.p1 TRINITY_DN23728_c0_g1~~TRINITY_DN23728_c0_g1_i1.p1  ORF type:complete len:719 (-),score=115.95 TRINITY_DN23728_c0_g1_i1:85-2241(-)